MVSLDVRKTSHRVESICGSHRKADHSATVESTGHDVLFWQKGAGLIEVMVSLLILGVGLLGVLSLQAKGLGSNQRAVFITEAHLLVQDMADRILAYGSQGSNRNAGAIDGNYDSISTTTTYKKPTCDASGCNASQTQLLDAYEWSESVSASSLPSAIGDVSWDASKKIYTVRLMWDQNRTGASAIDCDKRDKDKYLTCFSMEVGL